MSSEQSQRRSVALGLVVGAGALVLLVVIWRARPEGVPQPLVQPRTEVVGARRSLATTGSAPAPSVPARGGRKGNGEPGAASRRGLAGVRVDIVQGTLPAGGLRCWLSVERDGVELSCGQFLLLSSGQVHDELANLEPGLKCWLAIEGHVVQQSRIEVERGLFVVRASVDPGHHLEVEVRDSNGRTIRECFVDVDSGRSPGGAHRHTPNASGRAVISGLLAGRFGVYVGASGYERWIGRVEIPQITVLRVRLERSPFVRGVVRTIDGSPIAGAVVWPRRGGDPTRTDREGRFRLQLDRRGDDGFGILVEAKGYARAIARANRETKRWPDIVVVTLPIEARLHLRVVSAKLAELIVYQGDFEMKEIRLKPGKRLEQTLRGLDEGQYRVELRAGERVLASEDRFLAAGTETTVTLRR